MRPIYLLVNSMLQELGVDNVAKELNLTSAHVYKFGEDPEESGKNIPLPHILHLIALASDRVTNRTLQQIVDELLQHFAGPAGRRIVHDEDLKRLEEMLGYLKNGNGHAPKVVSCPQCGNENFFIKTEDGIRIEVCRTCVVGKGK